MKIIVMIFSLSIIYNSTLFSQGTDFLWTEEQLSNATVLLFQKVNDSTSSSGSGTIINYNSRYFLLTASHVAKELKKSAKIVFRLKGDKPGIYGFLPLLHKGLIKWKNHLVADMAMIELFPNNNSLQQIFQKCSFPIKQIYGEKELPSREADLTFLGFPIIDLKHKHFSPLIFTGYRASGLITQLRADTKTQCNFFYLNVPSIQGCSGSGVYFSVKKGGLYYKSKETLLIGIVHGTYGDNTGGKLSAITPSYYIKDLLTEF